MGTHYILSCCSTVDRTEEQLAAREIHYIPFHFMLGGEQYLDDLGKTIPFSQFYAAMASGQETSTSQVNVGEFLAYFEPFLQQGLDILHISLSSGLSGVSRSAASAAQELMEKYPQRTIHIVDSLGASSGYGLLMDQLADLRDGGMELDDLAQWATDHRLELHHWFFSTDLTYYIRGGRISKTAGMVGTLLGICPLLNMDHLGRLIPREKIRSKKRVIETIVNKMELCAQGGTAYDGKCYISHADCYEDARAVADLVQARFPHLSGHVEINSVGTTIGSHTGPGTVALFFWGSPRVN